MDELYELFDQANERTDDQASDAGRFYEMCNMLKESQTPEGLLAAEILEAVYAAWSCYVDPDLCD